MAVLTVSMQVDFFLWGRYYGIAFSCLGALVGRPLHLRDQGLQRQVMDDKQGKLTRASVLVHSNLTK